MYDRLTVFAEFNVTYTDPSKHVEYAIRAALITASGSRSILQLQPAKSGLGNVRPFYSCLFVVEAKRDGQVDTARGQLLGYLACVQAKRKEQHRNDVTVYGLATDGLMYVRFRNYQRQGGLSSSSYVAMRGGQFYRFRK
jgi:hypothetical protein